MFFHCIFIEKFEGLYGSRSEFGVTWVRFPHENNKKSIVLFSTHLRKIPRQSQYLKANHFLEEKHIMLLWFH
jgi:hypothetical protein